MASVWTVEVDLIDGWLATLDEKSYVLVVAGLEVLAEQGRASGGHWLTRSLGRHTRT